MLRLGSIVERQNYGIFPSEDVHEIFYRIVVINPKNIGIGRELRVRAPSRYNGHIEARVRLQGFEDVGPKTT